MPTEDQKPFEMPEPSREDALAVMANPELHRACCALMRTYVENRDVLTNWQAVVDYCRVHQAHADHEVFRVLFLDRKNVLIADETLSEGSLDHCMVYPRVVAKRALELNSSAIILVHNHPSGNCEASRADIDMTKKVIEALKALEIVVHDHVIVGSGGTTSMRTMGLI